MIALLIAALTIAQPAEKTEKQEKPERVAERNAEILLETRRLTAELDLNFRTQRRIVIPALLADLRRVAPDSAVFAYFIGLDQLSRGEAIPALISLRQAMKIDPAFAPAYSAAGLLLADAGKDDEALIYFDGAVSLSPHDPTYLLNAALCRWRLGQKKEALAFLDRAIAARPTSAEAWVYKARALADAGQLADAHAAYKAAWIYGAREPGTVGEFLRLSHRLGRHEDSHVPLSELEKDQSALAQRTAAEWLVRYGALSRARMILDRLFAQGLGGPGERALYVRILARSNADDSWLRNIKDEKERVELEKLYRDTQMEAAASDPVLRPPR